MIGAVTVATYLSPFRATTVACPGAASVAIARTLASCLRRITGPGFISLRLDDKWLAKHLELLLREGAESWAPEMPYKRACVDFSSPNVAKEMHVGHLRSTIIGDCIARVLEYCKVPLIRLNHIGDWGTQVGFFYECSEFHCVLGS